VSAILHSRSFTALSLSRDEFAVYADGAWRFWARCDNIDAGPVKIALIITDDREDFRDYARSEPYFHTAPEALLQGLAQMRDIEVHVISCLQRRVESPAKLADNIAYHSLFVPKFGWMRTGYQGCVRAVRRKLRELKPHIVHGQGTERNCALSAVLSGFPNVVTVHGNMRLIAKVNRAAPFTFEWIAARLESFTLPRADGVVCITNYTRQAVAPLAKRTWVVPNAVDQAFFDIPRQTSPTNRILCVAHITYRKNQVTLIDALDPVAARTPIEVIFLGRVPEGGGYAEDFKRRLQSRPWCRYGGFADRQAVKKHLESASLLVLPSREENCPMVVLEAMAAGVPVAAANVGGVPELIEDSVTGSLFDPNDLDDIRSKISHLLDQPAITRRMTDEAKRRAPIHYHPRAVAQRHLEIYREVLEKGKNPRFPFSAGIDS
jgi:glycosyltransferase involved in cell wall biosynthesis